MSAPLYRVRARNTAAASENKIHDDGVAAEYGFRGGLVPGVTIYGYIAGALVARYPEWLEAGAIEARFDLPFYDGDEVIVRLEETQQAVLLTAAREDGSVCATASARVGANAAPFDEAPAAALPDDRPAAAWELLEPGAALGSLRETLDLTSAAFLERRGFDPQGEQSVLFRGSHAIAHPAVLLGFANEILTRNFKLGPWIHVGSQVQNFGMARNGEEIRVRGRIVERFERKGHQFVALEVSIATGAGRAVGRVRHTAIFRPRPR